MAIYVHLSDQDFIDLLRIYDLGGFISFEGITDGVSNTNYHVFTDRGRYILTIFEENRTQRKDLPFLFSWGRHLRSSGIICPEVCCDREGQAIRDIKGRPAAFFTFLEGQAVLPENLTPGHCGKMGSFTAGLHRIAGDFSKGRENDWPFSRFSRILEDYRPHLEEHQPGTGSDAQKELEAIERLWPADLPQAVVHTDLFPDNIFFEQDRLHGVIDLHFSCTHALIYDLAIVINAWCFDGEGSFMPERFKPLIKAYRGVRSLQDNEKKHFQTACRLAALRFFVSRVEERFKLTSDQTVLVPHNPWVYLKRLRFHQNENILDYV